MRIFYAVLSLIAAPALAFGCHWLMVYLWTWWSGLWWVWELLLLLIAAPVTVLLIRAPFKPIQDGNPLGSVAPIIACLSGFIMAVWITIVGISDGRGWLYAACGILIALSGLYTIAETIAARSLSRGGV